MKIGDNLPSFVAKDAKGNEFDIEVFRGKKAVVIYFYPGDFTPVCTKEACSFRDAYQDFQDFDAEVIGISKDDKESHHKFEKKYNLPFVLLSDPEAEVAKKFGLKKTLGLIPYRETFVFSKEGKLLYQFGGLLKADAHIQKSLEVLKENA